MLLSTPYIGWRKCWLFIAKKNVIIQGVALRWWEGKAHPHPRPVGLCQRAPNTPHCFSDQLSFTRAPKPSFLKMLLLYSSKDTAGWGIGWRIWLPSLLVPEQISLSCIWVYFLEFLPARQTPGRSTWEHQGGEWSSTLRAKAAIGKTACKITFTFSSANLEFIFMMATSENANKQTEESKSHSGPRTEVTVVNISINNFIVLFLST